ncbi:MAG TPA: hypothetical protein VE223_03700 [Nitrososphaeraceae archaeon]|nr:hypothetical protein [Nitrososphaeraceae archaeon]
MGNTSYCLSNHQDISEGDSIRIYVTLHDGKNQNNNNSFIEKLKSSYSKTIDAILNHPYLEALEKNGMK